MADIERHERLLAMDSVPLQSFMDNLPVAMILADCTGVIRAVGRKIGNDFGYEPGELVGQNLKILMATPHRERHDGYIAHYRDTGERRIIGKPRIENALHKNGHAIAVEVNVGETEIDGEQMFIGFLRPIEAELSNRQQMQTMLAELSHISRVSAMGALATAIAHELNQPLTTIANFAAGARDRLASRKDCEGMAEIVEAMDRCSHQAVRAGQLLHRLREFVEPGDHDNATVTVEKLVDATITLALINGYRKSIVIDRDIAPGLPPVQIDPIQGEQVLYNLLRNAFEAMAEAHEREHRIALQATRLGDGMVSISVEDSGPGVAPDMREKIFESFVTTKAGGMGVGLAICRQIVESFGGSLELAEPAELGGARFVMSLPCGDPAGMEGEA